MLLEQSNAHAIVLLRQFIATDVWMPPLALGACYCFS